MGDRGMKPAILTALKWLLVAYLIVLFAYIVGVTIRDFPPVGF